MRNVFWLENKVARQDKEIKSLRCQLGVARGCLVTTREDSIANVHAAWKQERMCEREHFQEREEELLTRITHLEKEKSALECKAISSASSHRYLDLPPIASGRLWSPRTALILVDAMHTGHLSLSSAETVFSHFAKLFLGQLDMDGPDRLTIARWSLEVYYIRLAKVVRIAVEAGIIHIQIDTGRRRSEYHFPVRVLFWHNLLKQPVKFVLEDMDISRTTGKAQSGAIERALNNHNIPLKIVVTLGADNTASITSPSVGAAARFNWKTGGYRLHSMYCSQT